MSLASRTGTHRAVLKPLVLRILSERARWGREVEGERRKADAERKRKARGRGEGGRGAGGKKRGKEE
eukprot:3131817-Rhodomonas_salina.1